MAAVSLKKKQKTNCLRTQTATHRNYQNTKTKCIMPTPKKYLIKQNKEEKMRKEEEKRKENEERGENSAIKEQKHNNKQ